MNTLTQRQPLPGPPVRVMIEVIYFPPGADLTSIVETVGRVAAGTADGMVPA
jgi:hypothetical protein